MAIPTNEEIMGAFEKLIERRKRLASKLPTSTRRLIEAEEEALAATEGVTAQAPTVELPSSQQLQGLDNGRRVERRQ